MESTENNLLEQSDKTLAGIAKLLYIFGAFSLLSGGLDLFTYWMAKVNEMSLGLDLKLMSVISFVAGIVYIACGVGAKKRQEGAIWIAMIVLVVERFYGVGQALMDGADLNSSVIIGVAITFFLLSYLWNGIKTIRAIDEQPLFDIQQA
jgi:lysylphosphatidylglycerol synthetase-like protein (DUF2156 family)